jgi:glycosyltransferase involved in cell wall biosynthesis
VKIVSIAPYMPFPGIAHAGGELYRRHAELVARDHDVLVVAPGDATNESAMARGGNPSYRRLLVPPRLGRAFPGRRRFQRFLARMLPFLAVGPFLRALLSDDRAVAELRTADRIELQWFDSVVLAPRLRRAFPGIPIIGFLHDVVSQGHLRMTLRRGISAKWRLLALVRFLMTVPLEKRALQALSTAVVLSEKDRALLRRRGESTPVVVLPPPLDDTEMPAGPPEEPARSRDVLFVAALERYENEDAARWLLGDIWPVVRRTVPGAHLTIAGAGANEALRREAARHHDVELTGYVPSLRPYYERAAVAVVPMRLGAGVKLKGIVAMLWGVPVVATRVGAEGVGEPGCFVAVEDDAGAFANAVAGVLLDPASAHELAGQAFEWAHDVHSAEGYRRSVEQLYASSTD